MSMDFNAYLASSTEEEGEGEEEGGEGKAEGEEEQIRKYRVCH